MILFSRIVIFNSLISSDQRLIMDNKKSQISKNLLKLKNIIIDPNSDDILSSFLILMNKSLLLLLLNIRSPPIKYLLQNIMYNYKNKNYINFILSNNLNIYNITNYHESTEFKNSDGMIKSYRKVYYKNELDLVQHFKMTHYYNFVPCLDMIKLGGRDSREGKIDPYRKLYYLIDN